MDSASEDHQKMLASRSEDGVTIIPAHLGTGYIKGFVVENKLRLLVRQYEPIEDMLLHRGIGPEEQQYVMIAFQNLYRSKDDIKAQPARPSSGSKLLPSVQVSASGFNKEVLPGGKKINSIVLKV